MSLDLRAAAVDYLTGRRARGYRLADHDWLIRSFLDQLERRGLARITVAEAMAFARARPGVDQRWQATRLHVVRGLADYVHALDPAAAELIPPGLIRARVVRRHPYLYSEEQVGSLLAAASLLSPPRLAATIRTLIGLLWVTGLRIAEAIGLDVSDLDSDQQMLRVIGKYGRPRRVPLHPSTIEALGSYLAGRSEGPLFLGARGGRLNPNTAHSAFQTVLGTCRLQPRPGCGSPRLHDFRHSMAGRTLCDAQRSGTDVDERVATLADFLGHVDSACTYWYLETTPELMAAVSERVAVFFARRNR